MASHEDETPSGEGTTEERAPHTPEKRGGGREKAHDDAKKSDKPRSDDARADEEHRDDKEALRSRRRRIVVWALVLIAVTAAATWALASREPPASNELTLHGNVDLRQVDLAFEESGRVTAVLVDEGARVRSGDVLARLDTGRLAPQAAQADADAEAARQALAELRAGARPQEIDEARANVEALHQIVAKLRAGSRREEIEQARAGVESAKADEASARVRHDRLAAAFSSSQERSVSRQTVDDAAAAFDVAAARLVVAQRTLDLAVLGPREEDIAEARARATAAEKALDLVVAGPREEEIARAQAHVRAAEAQAALLHRRLSDAELVAPADSVVRTRVMEPGEMASPQRPVLSLAVLDPKWVRAYVDEPHLARVRPGLFAWVAVDGMPSLRFEGFVGFVSPVAEFTPKSVETEELRTSLVYEVRVMLHDPADALRLGMPATVHLALDRTAQPAPGDAAPPERRR